MKRRLQRRANPTSYRRPDNFVAECEIAQRRIRLQSIKARQRSACDLLRTVGKRTFSAMIRFRFNAEKAYQAIL